MGFAPVEETRVPTDGLLVDAHVRPVRPAPTGGHDRDPDHEQGERGQHERSPQNRADPYLGGFPRSSAQEDGPQYGHDGDHGLREGGADGCEHAPYRSLPEVQPLPQDLDRVGEQGGRDEDRGQG